MLYLLVLAMYDPRPRGDSTPASSSDGKKKEEGGKEKRVEKATEGHDQRYVLRTPRVSMMVTAPQRTHQASHKPGMPPGVRSRLRARGQAKCQDRGVLAHLHLCLQAAGQLLNEPHHSEPQRLCYGRNAMLSPEMGYLGTSQCLEALSEVFHLTRMRVDD